VKAAAVGATALFTILTVALGVYSNVADIKEVDIGYNFEAPTFIFCTLTIFDLLFYAFPPAGRPAVGPTLAGTVLHALPFISYLTRYLNITPILEISVAGKMQPVVPMRYIEWMCTTPFIQILLGCLSGANAQLVERIALYNFLTILFGGVARLLSNQALSLTLACIACIFGALTTWGMWMLICLIRKNAAGDKSRRMRVQLVGLFLLVTYTAYPVVFFAHYADILSTVHRERVYAGLDVAAKCAATTALLDGFYNLSLRESTKVQGMLHLSNSLKGEFIDFLIHQSQAPLDSARLHLDQASDMVLQIAKPCHGSQATTANPATQARNFSHLQEAVAGADRILKELSNSYQKMLVYKGLAAQEVQPKPIKTGTRALFQGLFASAQGLAGRDGILLSTYVAGEAPQLVLLDAPLWTGAALALITASARSSVIGSTLHIIVFMQRHNTAMGSLTLCVADSVPLKDQNGRKRAQALRFFENTVTDFSESQTSTSWQEKSLAGPADVHRGTPSAYSSVAASSFALSLAIAERSVQLMGGTLEVESLPPSPQSRCAEILADLNGVDVRGFSTSVPSEIVKALGNTIRGTFSCLRVPILWPPSEGNFELTDNGEPILHNILTSG
jgi:bacteriorhodopsin